MLTFALATLSSFTIAIMAASLSSEALDAAVARTSQSSVRPVSE